MAGLRGYLKSDLLSLSFAVHIFMNLTNEQGGITLVSSPPCPLAREQPAQPTSPARKPPSRRNEWALRVGLEVLSPQWWCLLLCLLFSGVQAVRGPRVGDASGYVSVRESDRERGPDSPR